MFAHLLDVLPAFLVASVILAALPGPATALFLHRAQLGPVPFEGVGDAHHGP